MPRHVTWKLLVSSYLGLARVSSKYHLHNRVDGPGGDCGIELAEAVAVLKTLVPTVPSVFGHYS